MSSIKVSSVMDVVEAVAQSIESRNPDALYDVARQVEGWIMAESDRIKLVELCHSAVSLIEEVEE